MNKKGNIKNLTPGRTGKTGVRKKLTKPLLEKLFRFADEEFDTFTAAVHGLAATNPEAYVNTMLALIKLIIDRETRIPTSEAPAAAAPAVTFNFVGAMGKEIQ